MSLQAKSAIAAVLLMSMTTCAIAQTPPTPKCIMQNFATLTLQDDGLAISAAGSINNDKAEMLIASGAPYTLVTRAETVKLGLLPAQNPAKARKHRKTTGCS